MKKVLVTGVGGNIGHSIIKCLRNTNYDLKLFGCDIDPYAVGRSDVDEFILSPNTSIEMKYDKFIQNMIDDFKIKYIFPAPEVDIIYFHKNREFFKGRNIYVFINNPFILNNFFDKYKTVTFLKECGLPYPITFLLKDYKNQLTFPIVIKPRFGCGGKQTIVLNSKRDFSFFKDTVDNAIVQEYLGEENEEYTTGIFSDGNKTFSITFRREIGHGGMSKVVELIKDRNIDKLSKSIAEGCNLVGSINVQTRRTKKGFVPFEINPRLSSTVDFRDFFGFHDVKWWIDYCENSSQVIDFKLKFKKGIGVRSIDKVFFDLKK